MTRRARWRPGRPLRVPAHRASSATLAGAYPFQVPPSLTSGVPIGVDVLTGQPFCFDPWALCEAGVLTNPNMLLAGVIGQGKSALAKSLAIRAVAAGRQVYVPGDPKGEWGIVADAVGGLTIALGHGLSTRINPLDVPSAERAGVLAAVAELLLRRPLVPAEHAALDAALTSLGDRPAVLADLLSALVHPEPPAAADDATTVEQRTLDGRELGFGLRRLVRGDLAGLFDGPTSHSAGEGVPMVVLDLSRLAGDDTALAVAMTIAGAWLDPVLVPGTNPGETRKRWIIYDEGWRLLRTPAQLRRMQSAWKLARAAGTANLLIIHRLSDLDSAADIGSAGRAMAEGLLADCSVRIIYRQEADQSTTTRDLLALTSPERHLVGELGRGAGLWHMPSRSSVVHHRMTADELGLV